MEVGDYFAYGPVLSKSAFSCLDETNITLDPVHHTQPDYFSVVLCATEWLFGSYLKKKSYPDLDTCSKVALLLDTE